MEVLYIAGPFVIINQLGSILIGKRGKRLFSIYIPICGTDVACLGNESILKMTWTFDKETGYILLPEAQFDAAVKEAIESLDPDGFSDEKDELLYFLRKYFYEKLMKVNRKAEKGVIERDVALIPHYLGLLNQELGGRSATLDEAVSFVSKMTAIIGCSKIRNILTKKYGFKET